MVMSKKSPTIVWAATHSPQQKADTMFVQIIQFFKTPFRKTPATRPTKPKKTKDEECFLSISPLINLYAKNPSWKSVVITVMPVVMIILILAVAIYALYQALRP